MKDRIRLFLWKILGINHYNFLQGQKKFYLHQARNTTIGFKTYHNGAFVWQWDKNSTLEIGSYCSIANDVNFILDDGFHLLSGVTTFPLFNHISNPAFKLGDKSISDFKNSIHSSKGDIRIGSDVWIGMNAIILPQVKIGNGVTIMAGAIVSSDVPDYALVGGVPAKIIKMKHEPEIIEALLQISWWNWSPQKVEENTADFYLPINEFILKWR